MSCFFCNSSFHLSQFCDKYSSNESRCKIAHRKNRCSKCFEKFSSHFTQTCDSFFRCYICYSNDHHTYLCKTKAYQLFPPSIDSVLLSRFIKLFDFIEKIQFAFYQCNDKISLTNLCILKESEIEYADIEFPKKLIYLNPIFEIYGSSSYFDMSKMGHCFSSVIALEHLHLSSQDFLTLLSPSLKSLECSSVELIESELKFSQILLKIPNIKVLKFKETNITVEKFWPDLLLKCVKNNNFNLLQLTLNDPDFDIEALARFVKEKTTTKASIHLDIVASSDYQEFKDHFTKKFEKFFMPVKRAANKKQRICVRTVQKSENQAIRYRFLSNFALCE